MLQFLILTLFIFIPFKIIAQDLVSKDVKNISYASSKIKILPLLKLKNPNLIDEFIVIFPHIPKVGETSLLQAIEPQNQINSKRFSVPRIKNVSPYLITPNWSGSYNKVQADCSNKTICAQYRLINGHFPYGVHQFMQNKYRYIALVRSPIEREISSLNFDYQRGFIKSKDDAYKYLFETTLDNPQVRMLAGKKHMSGICNEQTLNIAKANIEKDFVLVGITQDTDTFIQVMLTLFKLKPVAATKAQITGKKIIEQVPDDILIKEKHKYDMALYEYVKEKWNKWKQDNIIGTIAVDPLKKILTLTPSYMATSKAEYMSIGQIEQNNALYDDNALTEVIED